MTHNVQAVRNIAFVGHPSAGKTSLVDALGHLVGASPRKGSPADKTSIGDTEPEEHEKGHTLQLSPVSARHGGFSWTFVDTPGYPEFAADLAAAIFACELVVGVASCTSGVTYNFRKKMEQAAAQKRGRAVVVTHIDAENADFEALLENLIASIGPVCVPFQLPSGTGAGFARVESVFEAAHEDHKQRLMDRVMDACEDEALVERYLETESLSPEELAVHLPVAIARGAIVPVLCADSPRDIGTKEFMEFCAKFAPHAGLYPPPQGTGDKPQDIAPDPAGELCGTVFAVRSDPHVGKLALVKIWRGTLSAQAQVVGPDSKERGEKLGGLFRPVGKKKREPLEAAGPGEIACFSKVDGISSGQSFTLAGHRVMSCPMPALPAPMVVVALEPKSRADEQKIGEALAKLAAEDACFQTGYDKDTHELVMRGMSDLHLQVMESRLKRRYGVEITTRVPRIAYLETITKAVEGHHRHKKQTGGRGQFGECYIRLKPLEKGKGFVFVDDIVGGSIPRNLIPAVEKGVREVVERGVLTKGRVIDVEVSVHDGKFHAVDSDEASFKIAGARAFTEAFRRAGPILLEPLMDMIVTLPTKDAGHIFSDLTSHRRGHVVDQWIEDNGAVTVIKAKVPLSAVLTYHRDLKSQTAGEGNYSLTFADYAAVPMSEQAKILAESGREKEKHDEAE